MVVELVAEAEIRTRRHFLHRLRRHSAEQSLRTKDRWRLSSPERLVAHSAASSQLLRPAKHSQLDRPPTHLHQLHKLPLGPVDQL